MKKITLRDVRNDNRSFVCCHPEYSCVLGEQVMDAIKVPGTKMLTSECPCSPALYKSLSCNDANEQLTHARVNLDTEPGKRKNQGNSEENVDFLNSKRYLTKQLDLSEQTKKPVHETPCLPSFASISTASLVTSSPGKPEFPDFLGKPGNNLPAIDSKRPFTSRSVVPCLVETGGKMDQQWREQFVRLPNLLKHFDESDHRDYIHLLCDLSAPELSRHAIELEKISMQLSVEEA
ncbi:hypothetical protein FNV43_RR12077 [Rhamnella rubrinervis]|uniref:Uncharacterized protein n=1 Tax=Rhamnella rubrinervis TaxID=2594499 RepID=A0A8K0H6R5_9ROSA|nr:hypothetical protein FNV43_RR12077 [Rhamnella rubrinervis]